MTGRPRASTLATLLLLYIGILLLGSLYPFTGWLSPGDWNADFLTAPLPKYITRTDVTTNLLVYLPLGYGLALLLSRPRGRNLAILATMVLGCGLSLGLESLQVLLPRRIASNLDIFLNSLGVLAGALLSLHHSRWLRAARRLRRWRHDWFQADKAASIGLALLALWAFSQLALLPFPGTGWLELHLRPVDTPPERLDQIKPAWLLAVLFEMTAVGAFMSCLLRPGRYASALLLLFVSAFALKLLAATLLLKLRVVGGVLSLETIIAFVLALWFLLLPSVSRHRQGVALLLLGIILLARLALVDSPLWPDKSALNLVGLASHVAALWPWLALALCSAAWFRVRARSPGA